MKRKVVATLLAVILLIVGIFCSLLSGFLFIELSKRVDRSINPDSKYRTNKDIIEDSKTAFEAVSRVTVIDCRTMDIIVQMTGRLCTEVIDGELYVIAELSDGDFRSYQISLSDNITYVVENLYFDEEDVEKCNFSIDYNDCFFGEICQPDSGEQSDL